MAWIASLSQDGCDYAKLIGNGALELTNRNIPWIEVGFNSYRIPKYYGDNQWQVYYVDECITLPSQVDNIEWTSDPYWQFGSVMSVISTIVGGGGCLFLWIVAVGLVVTKSTWRWVGFKCMIASFCSTLSFLWFLNQRCSHEGSECHLLYGSKANIASLFLYAASSLSIIAKYPEPKVLRLVEKNYEHEFQHFKREPTIAQLGDIEVVENAHLAEKSARTKLSILRERSSILMS